MKRVVLIGLLLVGGCGIFEPASDDEERLENAIAGWKRLGISEYSYVYSRTCECPPEWQRPVMVLVRDGEVAQATDVETGATRDITRMPTIDDLFTMIREALDEDADLIRISYDRQWHYPIDMLIDSDLSAADDDLIMKAWALIRIK